MPHGAYGCLRNEKGFSEITIKISHQSKKPTDQQLAFAGETPNRNCAQRACTHAWSAISSCSQPCEFGVQNVAPSRAAEAPESQVFATSTEANDVAATVTIRNTVEQTFAPVTCGAVLWTFHLQLQMRKAPVRTAFPEKPEARLFQVAETLQQREIAAPIVRKTQRPR